MIAKVLFVMGVVAIVYGATRWKTIEEVTSKSTLAFDQFAETQRNVGGSNQNFQGYTWTDWDYPKEFRTLKLKLSLAGGMHHGMGELIVFEAIGLILIAISSYKPGSRPPPKNQP